MELSTMVNGAYRLDVEALINSRIGNFICGLKGSARSEAVNLLYDLHYEVLAHGLSGGHRPVHTFLNLKPIKLKNGRTLFEKRSKNIRIYLEYAPGKALKIIHGGLKHDQPMDLERLGRGLSGPRRGRRRTR